MTVNFRFNNGGTDVDFDDVFIRRDLFAQGNLWTWGYNFYGQLGDNTRTDRSSPVQTVSGGLNWKQVAAGTQFSAGIKTDGTLWLWGIGTNGQLGNNSNTVNVSSPIQTISGGTNWKQVSCGRLHTGAIKTDGSLWMWGYNFAWGLLGTNDEFNRSSPVQTIAGGNNWKLVSAGGSMTAAIKTDGSLWTWGLNNFGQLGNNAPGDRSSPVQTVAVGNNWNLVSCGRYHVAAIKTDGTLWLWGGNTNFDPNGSGQLGDNTTVNKSSPVQTVSQGTNWKLVSCGHYYTAAIKTDGTLWLWGNNDFGQLGDNTNNISKSSPIQTISGGTNWKYVNNGSLASVTIAIKTDGTLWVWGGNYFGSLCTNDIISRSSPVQTIAGGTNWKQVVTNQQTLAITDLDVYEY